LRKAIFIFLGLLLALSMFSFPADTISAQTTTTPQLSPSSPAAMQAGEKELIDDILRELDQARKLTNDKDIQNQIGVIKEWVKKVQALENSGDTKAAIDIKYTIAKRLEWLINQLPTATPGTTTAIAAMPASNPLYDELVRIRAKIDKLIDIEEREIPTEKPPPPPEIQRPPEMEKLIVYSAKFLCGPAFGGEGVQPGSYSTAINIHNPYNETIYLFKKAVIALPEDQARGRISSFRKVALGPDEAIEVDCIDIVKLFGPQQEVALSAPSQQAPNLLQTTAVTPISSIIHFIKGFVVIYATAPLDVVAVYTASTKPGASLDLEIERIPPSTVGVPPVRIPEEEACPQGCDCMTKDEAYGKLGPNATMCQDTPCDKNASGVLRYCWKPGEEVKCPEGCVCMTKEEAIKQGSPPYCNYEPCGRDQYQNLMYCFQKPTGQSCPTGCVCLTKDDAYKRYGQNATMCQDQPCGYDAQQNPLYCWKSAEVGKPSLTLEPAEATNNVGEVHKLIATVRDANGNPVRGAQVSFNLVETGSTPVRPTDTNGQAVLEYSSPEEHKDTIVASVTVDSYELEARATKVWVSKPTEAACPQECYCLTKDEAYGKLGANATLCQEQPCGYTAAATGAAQIEKYCWKAAEQVQCPQGCYCLSQSDAKQRGYTDLCTNQSCGIDQYNNPMYCYKPPTQVQCPQGCYCLTKADADSRGYTTLCQEQPCGYVAGATTAMQTAKYCYKPPAQVTCPQGCVCATPDEAKKYGYVYCQNQQIQCGTNTYCFQRAATTETKPTPARILIDPAQARNPVGSQHTITIVVYDTNGKPMANVRVKISHTGANSFAPIELTTDANGKCSYYYTGKNVGTDTIVAKVDSLSATATKEWYTITPTIRTPTLK